MTNINLEDEEIIENPEMETDLGVENRKKYADLVSQANAENKVIYQHEDGEYELVDQETYNTCIYDGEKWVEDENKLAEYKKVLAPQTLSRFQARRILKLTPYEDKTLFFYTDSYISSLDTSIEENDAIVDAWNDAREFDRNSPTILMAQKMFKLTDEQVDDMFIQGAGIVG